MKNPPFITDDTVVFGLLMLLLAFVFYTSAIKEGFWKKFYVVFPSLLMCYLLPSIFSSLNIISPEWSEVAENGEIITKKSSIYFIASRYLLPAALANRYQRHIVGKKWRANLQNNSGNTE